jgi:beta-xylosidase
MTIIHLFQFRSLHQFIRIAIALKLLLVLPCLIADTGNRGAWGDQGDGTFKNPILPGDFSDPDVIRVGDDYYLVTSTFQYSPGIAILHSKDMVNWEYLGHALPDPTKLGKGMNWDEMKEYGKGVYACSIRYHDGRFWIYTTTLNHGIFMTSAPSINGPWDPPTLVWKETWCDDDCPFWDDDGQAYLVYSDIGKGWFTHLVKMSSDGKSLDLSSDRVIDDFKTSEGNKIYKINGTYYIFHNEVRGPGNRVGMMLRSRNIWGPYEKKEILHGSGPLNEREPNQGALVENKDGSWWFFTHQGNGDYEGRPTHLLSVQWIDGWPIPGKIDESGAGNLVWSYKKPIAGFPKQALQTDDEFSDATLSPQWEWNYHPRMEKWSLTERPGFLRLYAFQPIDQNLYNKGKKPGKGITDPFYLAGNSLTQRVIGYSGGEVVTKMDVAGMSDGQTAGLALFHGKCARIQVIQQQGVRTIQLTNNEVVTPGPVLKGNEIWLKAEINDKAEASFAYSLDGKKFEPLGDKFTLGWALYRGTRIALFTYNTLTDTGTVDFDWFHYHYRTDFQTSPGVH